LAVKNNLFTYYMSKNFVSGLCIGLGVSIGLYIVQEHPNQARRKIIEAFNSIEKYYVDPIDDAILNRLTDVALKHIAYQLDPHTHYISAEENKMQLNQLNGSFEGIGAVLTLVDNTPYVLKIHKEGPAEKAGIQPGDFIVAINEFSTKQNIKDVKEVIHKINGPVGTKHHFLIQRKGQKENLTYTLQTATLCFSSIEIAYLITSETGYIQINEFGNHTHNEFIAAVEKLLQQGMKQLIIDLRGNSGGYLTAAVDLASEFLKPGDLIVSLKGNYKSLDKKFYAKKSSQLELEHIPLVLLIDTYSASASEVLAGALQDHDRALIVGRRSFGKGLVQMPVTFKDNSVLNLTIERYFTPNGRSIQKNYEFGKRKDYQLELYQRYDNGELFDADSIKHVDQQLQFKTMGGKTVYGGGGITPDHFVPIDQFLHSTCLQKFEKKHVMQRFAIEYVQVNRLKLEKMSLQFYNNNYNLSAKEYQEFIAFAKQIGVTLPEPIDNQIEKIIKQLLKSSIAALIWEKEGFYTNYHKLDKVIVKALSLVENDKQCVSNPHSTPNP